jgi:hypothetical protein
MIRNLKILGLALVAVFAFGAMTASGAMAQTNGTLTVKKANTEVLPEGEVTLTGVATGAAEANQLEAFGQTVRCPEATYTGHKYRSGDFLKTGAETITITPHYNRNGCDYEFHIGETSTHANDSYKVDAFVVCPLGKRIVVTAYGSAAKHEAEEPFCVTTITERGEEEAYSGLIIRDTTNDHLDITEETGGIVAHRESPTGSILCEEATTEEAVLKLDVTVSGDNDEGKETPIGLHH